MNEAKIVMLQQYLAQQSYVRLRPAEPGDDITNWIVRESYGNAYGLCALWLLEIIEEERQCEKQIFPIQYANHDILN